jgi:choline dehydrogenase-like flavoprotein
MNLNLKAKDQNSYDAIVIGSGISGGWAAKELCEKGLKTLVLERGRDVKHVQDYPTTMSSPWEMTHRGQYPPDVIAKNPIQSKVGYAFNEYSGHFFIRDDDHPYIQEKPFDWVRGYQTGGKSLLWARWVQRWSDLDFEANAREGIAIDWPIRYKDIAPWYSYVEKFVGVSGTKEGIAHLPDGEFLPPFEMNCIENHFKNGLKKHYPDRHYIISRTANLTQPQPWHTALGRSACQSRNWCARGCPYGAYFSTQSSTLPAAVKTGNLTLRPDSVVHSIIYDEKAGRATGVRVVDAKTKEMTEFYARIIFVNAATINTTLILLNSTSGCFPNGLGNDSDQLGRNLMDHNYRARISGVYEGSEYESKYYYGRRPAGTYLARFRNVGKDKQTGFVRGYSMACGGGRNGWGRGNGEAGFGADFKAQMTEPGGWNFSLTAMGEMLPNPDNRVTLDKDKKDAWGMPTVKINCQWRENEDAMTRDAVQQGQEMMEAAGFKVTAAFDNGQAPGLAIHEMGTARMGRDPKTSVLNEWNQMHACPNVFVTDGACMASSACQNPSLTYMALTARAVDHAVAEMKKRNLQ